MSKNLPALRSVIFVPDGDMAEEWTNPQKNLLALPGDKRPETLIYRHLFKMQDSDPFWKQCGKSYSRQFAITRKKGKFLGTGDDKKWVKNWYNGQSEHWGLYNQKAFKSWVKAHKPECLEFSRKFIKLLKQKYKGQIPKIKIDRTLAEFKDS